MQKKLLARLQDHPVARLGEQLVTCGVARRGNPVAPIYTLNIYIIWPRNSLHGKVPQSGKWHVGQIALTGSERTALRETGRLSYSEREAALHRWVHQHPSATLLDPLELLGMIHE